MLKPVCYVSAWDRAYSLVAKYTGRFCGQNFPECKNLNGFRLHYLTYQQFGTNFHSISEAQTIVNGLNVGLSAG